MPSNPFRKNYVRIAEFVTKFYLELQRNHGNRFKDETSLLATAGVMTVLDYILPPKAVMSVSEIIVMANDALSNEKAKDPLFPFLFDLEVGLEVAASPNVDREKVRLFLIMKGDSIFKAVEKTRKKYKSEFGIVHAIGQFFKLAENKEVREMLSIAD